MKSRILFPAISIIIIVSVVGSILYFESLPKPDTSIDPKNQLMVNNLSASPTGQVSFDVTNENLSGEIEAVIVNGKQYSWSEGSQDAPLILQNETKQWSIDIGSLEENDSIQVIVEASVGSASANATVVAPMPNDSTPGDPIDDPQIHNNQTLPDYVYDYYGGVNLFREGIHVIATSQDPRTLFSEYDTINNYWRMLLEHETNQATDQDFISIILSRGDKTSGGYNIQIENFAWLESYPVKFLFQVNFTDPGEGVATTDALTNPLVLVTIGKLTVGEYKIEVPITQYVLNIDQEGNPSYIQILTFAPVIWEQKLTINVCPKTKGFGIFFAENNELVISENEIIGYNKSSHEIYLTGEGTKRIENLILNNPMDGTAFILRINGEDLYGGWFWSPASSIPCSEVVIQTLVRDNTIQITTGYPDSNFQGEDPRNNLVLLNYFASIGKLVD